MKTTNDKTITNPFNLLQKYYLTQIQNVHVNFHRDVKHAIGSARDDNDNGKNRPKMWQYKKQNKYSQGKSEERKWWSKGKNCLA